MYALLDKLQYRSAYSHNKDDIDFQSQECKVVDLARILNYIRSFNFQICDVLMISQDKCMIIYKIPVITGEDVLKLFSDTLQKLAGYNTHLNNYETLSGDIKDPYGINGPTEKK